MLYKSKVRLTAALAALILVGCDKQTRNGELLLAGSAPVRLIDESGAAVEFPSGPTKIEFSAGSDRKFTVTVSQGDARKARFSGRAPRSSDSWNFVLRGREIGQPVDLASARALELYGRPWRQVGDGGSCGWNGRWVVEEEYQKCNEDWKVDFTDAASSQALGSFRSRREGQSCLLSSRQIYCRDEQRPPYPPIPPRLSQSRTEAAAEKLSALAEAGVRFD